MVILVFVPKRKHKDKTKTKLLSSPESMEAVRWAGEDLRLEGFMEKLRFEVGVKKKSRSDGW